MRPMTATSDSKKEFAAQNAKDGLVTVSELSLLTGVAASQLTKFAKMGQLENFGEYHGKRFFNFQSIVTWAIGPGANDEARTAIRNGMEAELRSDDCPYFIKKIPGTNGTPPQIMLCWKFLSAA